MPLSCHFSEVYFFLLLFFCSHIYSFFSYSSYLKHSLLPVFTSDDLSLTHFFSFIFPLPSLPTNLIFCGYIFYPFPFISWHYFLVLFSLLPALFSRRNFTHSWSHLCFIRADKICLRPIISAVSIVA